MVLMEHVATVTAYFNYNKMKCSVCRIHLRCVHLKLLIYAQFSSCRAINFEHMISMVAPLGTSMKCKLLSVPEKLFIIHMVVVT
jgi:hypothetical protein